MEDTRMVMNVKKIKISGIEILPFPARKGHVGFASIKIDENFLLSDLALFTRLDGTIRIGYPKKRLSNGAEVTVFKPLSREVDSVIEEAISKVYFDLMDRDGRQV